MQKLILAIITITILTGFFTKSAKADEEAGISAVPKFRQVASTEFDYREYRLRKFLTKFNSPLTPYSRDFIAMADYYGIDWRMVPAISGVESTFGKHIPINSYNAYGWAGGNYRFESWSDSIKIVNKTLRENYVNKGATSITKIARIYAPPSTTWGTKVSYFVRKIDILPLSFDL
jgi:hypothetical protein